MAISIARSTLVLLASCIVVPTVSQACSSAADVTPPAADAGTVAKDASSSTDAAITPPAKTFFIGGTIMGLKGTGLVLVNGKDTLPITASGASVPFKFPTPVASGATFQVKVSAQPSAPAQRCVVTGSDGTVVAGDITSVAVNCTAETFTVGGTVTGLAGTGLVLTNNNGPDLIVNGTSFAFPAKVEGGQPYDVKVKTDPANPYQTCTVDAPSSGTVGGGNVSVKVTCTTKTFAIKGVVKGLYGAGLSLSNNGEVLGVAAGAAGADVPFTFVTKIVSGVTYTVSVGQDPSAPTQTCAVTAGATAKVANADIQNVVVTCTCPPGSVTFDYTGAAQTFNAATLPTCATSITIDAYGAAGGMSTGQNGGQSFKGGLGARVKSTFVVAPADVLDLTVGKQGDDSNCGSGGGGGSFATRAGTVLVAAGGGGGGFSCTVLGNALGGDGRVTTSGGDGICTTMPGFGPRDPRTGGTNGNGGSSAYGGGGGGVLSAGVGSVSAAAGGAQSPGAGGTPGGGFGSGGGYFAGCCGGAGGGGGYSGGSGGQSDGCAGGGGGSYTTGADQTLTAGARAGNGQIVVSW